MQSLLTSTDGTQSPVETPSRLVLPVVDSTCRVKICDQDWHLQGSSFVLRHIDTTGGGAMYLSQQPQYSGALPEHICRPPAPSFSRSHAHSRLPPEPRLPS